jgi:phosphoribosyl 1,2-cyclic phosphate phosphodiesterase
MVVRLLGTGAADGVPAYFSNSRVSNYAREHGGKDVRSRSAAIIDGQLKIDLPPDTLMQLQRDNLDARDWIALLYTHSDADHFAVEELQYSLFPFCENEFAPFTIYANETVVKGIHERFPDWPFEVYQTRSFVPFQVAEYKITPVSAYHSITEDCQNLIIEHGGVSFLYGTDTGVWRERTWEFLEGVRLDGMVIECTNGGSRSSYWGHLNVEDCIAVVKQLREMGTLKKGAPVITTHHSHDGAMIHCELERALCPHGIQPGYDGMEVEIYPLG